MILKGRTRNGAMDLALHLSNSLENEVVTIAQMRGVVADNLYDGFREIETICAQTNAKKAFYSLSINPDPSQRDWGDAEWHKAINHIEQELGFANQPRTIVYHEKEGENGHIRKHCHVVWSRIIRTDNGQLKAVHLGNDHYKLGRCAKELAKEFGLELRYHDKAHQAYDHAQSHGLNRDPHTAAQRQKILTEKWEQSDSAQSFIIAVKQEGYTVAQGSRRTFVVVDQDEQIHSLARQIKGVNTKTIKARLGDPEVYPNVDQAIEEIRIRKEIGEKEKQQRLDLSREQRLMAKLRRMAIRADQLHQSRTKVLDKERGQLSQSQKIERKTLRQKQHCMEAKRLRIRADKKPKGTFKTLSDALGISKLLTWLDTQEDIKRQKHALEQRQELQTRHDIERRRYKRKLKYLKQQEKRESASIARIAKKINLKEKDLNMLTHIQAKTNSKDKAKGNSISLA